MRLYRRPTARSSARWVASALLGINEARGGSEVTEPIHTITGHTRAELRPPLLTLTLFFPCLAGCLGCLFSLVPSCAAKAFRHWWAGSGLAVPGSVARPVSSWPFP